MDFFSKTSNDSLSTWKPYVHGRVEFFPSITTRQREQVLNFKPTNYLFYYVRVENSQKSSNELANSMYNAAAAVHRTIRVRWTQSDGTFGELNVLCSRPACTYLIKIRNNRLCSVQNYAYWKIKKKKKKEGIRFENIIRTNLHDLWSYMTTCPVCAHRTTERVYGGKKTKGNKYISIFLENVHALQHALLFRRYRSLFENVQFIFRACIKMRFILV